MSAPFTPGPWHYLDMGEIVPSDSDGFPNAGTRICFMATPGSAINAHERIEANANLIAAAPELYEAAQTVLDGLNARIDDACENNPESVPVFAGIADLHAALAKARGEAVQA